MAPKAAATEKTFSSDTMKGLLTALIKRGVTIGNADFVVMAKVDTNATASSLEHQFRGLKKQAAEIAKTIEGEATPVKAARTPKTTTPGTAKKRAAKAVEAEDGNIAEETPSKKKAKKEKAVKKERSVTPEAEVEDPVVEDEANTNPLTTSFFEDAIVA